MKPETRMSGRHVAWAHLNCRLTASGCQVKQLTNGPSWDEQPIFTPDGKDVIFMSTRDHPGFYNTFTALTQAAGLTADEDWLFAWDPRNEFLLWTQLRIPDRARVPVPVDLVAQLQATAAYLRSPNAARGEGGQLAAVPIESRTRVLRFGVPGPSAVASTCSRRPRLRLRLPHDHDARVVRAEVRVNGTRLMVRHGHALRTVSLRRPAARRFVLRLVIKQNDGERRGLVRRYSRCPRG